MIDQIRNILQNWLERLQLGETFAFVGIAFVLALGAIIQWLIAKLAFQLLSVIVKRHSSDKQKKWIAALKQRFVARRCAHVVAVLLVYALLPYALESHPQALAIIRNLLQGYLVMVAVVAVNALLGATFQVYSGDDKKDALPLRIATQAAQGIVTIVGVIVAFSVVFDKPVTVLLSGVAGATALLMLLFKDTILGFVAGIQLSQNDMLRFGDWIEVPQYGANGTVKDVRLTTVKVQNFDKTITTIPTYALVSESFKNWRGMKESGARRIKRSVAIDMESIHFLSEAELQELQKVYLLQSYLTEQLAEIEAYNATFALDVRHPPNARGLTNLGTFRVYLEKYLDSHAALKKGMLILVRHLDPSPEGLPIEVYGFSQEQDWEEYERIQSNIFEHILAIMPNFGLEVYQYATSPSTRSSESA